MPLDGILTTAELKALFTEEIVEWGGEVSDAFDDGVRLFARAVLPRQSEVRKADRLQAGVALRATWESVWVHPYVFRLVCRNGAILAHAAAASQVEFQEFMAWDEAAEAVRTAIRGCCEEEVFAVATAEMRKGVQTPADMAVALMHVAARLPQGAARQLLDAILERFAQAKDSSRFGLMNAITSLARDTQDPELRWRLEELGGGVPEARVLVS